MKTEIKLCVFLVLLLGWCDQFSAQSANSVQRVPEGSDVLVPCEHEGRVAWSKLANGKRTIIFQASSEDDPDQIKPYLDPRFRLLTNLSLMITETLESDSGIYFCNATPVVDLQVSKVKANSVQRVPEGSDVLVPCEHEGRVAWSKLANEKRTIIFQASSEDDPDQIKPYSDPRFRLLTNLSLMITETLESDSGIYFCNATPVVDLQVSKVKANSVQRVPEGSDVLVPCEHEGRVAWSKLANGKRTIIFQASSEDDPDQIKPYSDPRFRLLTNLSLMITETLESDSGIYFCNATPVVDLQVSKVKGTSSDILIHNHDHSVSATGGVSGVERGILVSVSALFLFLSAVE